MQDGISLVKTLDIKETLPTIITDKMEMPFPTKDQTSLHTNRADLENRHLNQVTANPRPVKLHKLQNLQLRDKAPGSQEGAAEVAEEVAVEVEKEGN